ncbi:hypothetical protein SAMN05444487_11227 [Marininema mesophilum]|uniref:Uncharacterized protein n=1 Tax=Marininema mesophilum TaxID=1048340 RepID=A0A1H2ZVB6_9BACL|nr:hypothetical protein [Marininema mesophilum]SDX21552.1 hypothetical protein SAMN05444487_11227 [Marininema mesophilum]
MRADTDLFRGTGRSIWVVAHAFGLILLLFGLYFTVLEPPKTADWESLIFYTSGGWMILGGLSLFLISLANLWRTQGLYTVKLPRESRRQQK